MPFLAVRWLHDLDDDPVLISAELDANGVEIRKVETFRDGRLGFSDATREHGGTYRSVEPWPAVTQIAADPQFVPEAISAADFERLWSAATALL